MIGSSLIQFIIFILPGYITISVYRYKYPVRIRADNHDIIWGAVFGLLEISILTLLFPDVFSSISTYDSKDFNILKQGCPILVIIISGFSFGILSVVLTIIRDKVLYKVEKLKFLKRVPPSIWDRINSEYDFCDCWAVVFLIDGSIYRGFIKYYQYDPNIENQDFLLAKASRVDENLKEKYSVAGPGVYLSTANVNKIELFNPGNVAPTPLP